MADKLNRSIVFCVTFSMLLLSGPTPNVTAGGIDARKHLADAVSKHLMDKDKKFAYNPKVDDKNKRWYGAAKAKTLEGKLRRHNDFHWIWKIYFDKDANLHNRIHSTSIQDVKLTYDLSKSKTSEVLKLIRSEDVNTENCSNGTIHNEHTYTVSIEKGVSHRMEETVTDVDKGVVGVEVGWKAGDTGGPEYKAYGEYTRTHSVSVTNGNTQSTVHTETSMDIRSTTVGPWTKMISHTEATEKSKRLYFSGPVVLDGYIKFGVRGRANVTFKWRSQDIWLKASDLLTEVQRTVFVEGYSKPVKTSVISYKQSGSPLKQNKAPCP